MIIESGCVYSVWGWVLPIVIFIGDNSAQLYYSILIHTDCCLTKHWIPDKNVNGRPKNGSNPWT
jgi:hypothetical protein